MALTLTRYKIVEALREKEGQLVSGGELAAFLGITRAAVWKAVSSLQEEGYQIQSVANKGYRFLPGEVYSGYEVERRLQTSLVGRPLLFLTETDSTNDHAKRLAMQGGENGTAILALRQTGGKGRLGRSFESPDGQGVYCTILLRPDIGFGDLNLITLLAAVAVCDTIEERTGILPGIKWTNDIYLNERKLCGILTECSVEGEGARVSYAVVGMGINLFQRKEDFHPAIQDIAGSVEMTTGVHVPMADFAASLLKNFEKRFFDEAFPKNKTEILERYRKCLFIVGRRVEVRSQTGDYPATVLDIDEEGRLLVRDDSGSIHALLSGEISIKLS